MSISDETIKAILRDYNGFELSDEELSLVRPEIDSYIKELENLEDLDLSDVMSGRLPRAIAGTPGGPDDGGA